MSEDSVFQSANGSKLPSSINRLISKEVNSITGNDTIITYIKVIDSLKYTGNFNFKVPYGWQIYLISGPSAGQWLIPNELKVTKFHHLVSLFI